MGSFAVWKWRQNKSSEDPQPAIRNPQSGQSPAPVSTRFLPPELLASVSSMELLARTVVEGFIAGLHRSPFTGFSTEFAEYRQYMPGDDLRYLDWKLLGRTDRYYIKKYRADTNTQCHVLLDTSSSMKYASGPISKLRYGQFLTAALSYLVNQQQDSTGLILFDDRIRHHVPARSRTGQMQTIFGTLQQVESGGETSVATVLNSIAELLTKRGVIIVVSDLYDDPEAIIRALQHLRFRGNDVIVFQVMDKNELTFDFNDPVLLEDLETQEQLHVLPDVLAEGYRATIGKHVETLREACAASRIDYELLTTDQPLDFALYAFLAKRAKQ
ncbi:MAG: DUF58 domain-containing protein [Blastocatellia bacterium]